MQLLALAARYLDAPLGATLGDRGSSSQIWRPRSFWCADPPAAAPPLALHVRAAPPPQPAPLPACALPKPISRAWLRSFVHDLASWKAMCCCVLLCMYVLCCRRSGHLCLCAYLSARTHGHPLLIRLWAFPFIHDSQLLPYIKQPV